MVNRERLRVYVDTWVIGGCLDLKPSSRTSSSRRYRVRPKESNASRVESWKRSHAPSWEREGTAREAVAADESAQESDQARFAAASPAPCVDAGNSGGGPVARFVRLPRWSDSDGSQRSSSHQERSRQWGSFSLIFSDGVEKRVNVLPLLRGPVFEPLLDAQFFSRVSLDPVARTVVWPNGADLAPEALWDLPEGVAEPRRRPSLNR